MLTTIVIISQFTSYHYITIYLPVQLYSSPATCYLLVIPHPNPQTPPTPPNAFQTQNFPHLSPAHSFNLPLPTSPSLLPLRSPLILLSVLVPIPDPFPDHPHHPALRYNLSCHVSCASKPSTAPVTQSPNQPAS